MPGVGGIPLGARPGNIEQFVALFLYDFILLPFCQQVVENIVAGYDSAVLGDFARSSIIAPLKCAGTGPHKGFKKRAGAESGLSFQAQFFTYHVEERRFSRAVASIKNGDLAKFQARKPCFYKDMYGVGNIETVF